MVSLEQGSVDVVLAPAWIPDANGVEFLDRVMERWPGITRMLLSDSALLETAVRGLGKAHHHVLDAAGLPTLLQVLARWADFKSTVSNPKLPLLMARMRQLPSPPESYFQVLEEVRSSDASVQRIGDLIVQDPALSAKVLQLANSAVFALQLQVTHPAEAVAYLGVETTKALLLLAHTFSYFEQVDCGRFSVTAFQCHAFSVGRWAQRIAQCEECSPDVQNQAFTAGLLHDVGKLLLAANLPGEFSRALAQSEETGRPLWQIESELLGANHAELGGAILNTWLLPKPIVDAVVWHHALPSGAAASFSPGVAVFAANLLERSASEPAGEGARPELSEQMLAVADAKRWEVWQRCQYEAETPAAPSIS